MQNQLGNNMAANQSYKREVLQRRGNPVELHKVRVVQKLNLDAHRGAPARDPGGRLQLVLPLPTQIVFLDMLTDSGTNAMSDRQVASMLVADDAYAGRRAYARCKRPSRRCLAASIFLPVHQGRAAEHIISQALRQAGRGHPDELSFHHHQGAHRAIGGKVLEIYGDEAVKIKSKYPVQGQHRHRQAAQDVISTTAREQDRRWCAWRPPPT